jgi:hypothetical protein
MSTFRANAAVLLRLGVVVCLFAIFTWRSGMGGGSSSGGGGGGGGGATRGSRYLPDAAYAPFLRGEAPLTWGLNCVAWQASADGDEARALAAAYETWRVAAEREMAGTGAFIYPWAALHVTASTPAPFSSEGARAAWAPADREAFVAAWAAALRRARGDARWPAAPFHLIFSAPKFSNGAGIFAVADPTGAVAAARAALAAAAAAAPELAALPPALRATSGEKTPSIVHATVMRLARPRDAGVTDDEIEARWARAAAAWPGAIPVMARAARFVVGNELAVFAGGAEAGAEKAFAADVPFAPAAAA